MAPTVARYNFIFLKSYETAKIPLVRVRNTGFVETFGRIPNFLPFPRGEQKAIISKRADCLSSTRM